MSTRNRSELPGASLASTKWIKAILAFVTIASAGWLLHHVAVLAGVIDYGAVYPWVFTVLLVLWAQQQVMSLLERPYRLDGKPSSVDDSQEIVGVVIPVYNEDVFIFETNLRALLGQSRRPDAVAIVNDGSSGELSRQYDALISAWSREAKELGVVVHYVSQDNAGKRGAQVSGFRALDGFVTLIVTIDSDSVLDKNAIREIVKPFADARVSAVGGINTGINTDKNMLTRLSDLLHIQWQLVARSAQNVFHRITVNSGRLACYRAQVCIDNMDAYLNETFLGAPVRYSDDSMLTMYAMQYGRTIQQPSAITFTWHPENWHFLVRQRIRWMKGWVVRSVWRFRYLPLRSYALWSEIIDLFRLILGTTVTVMLLVVRPLFMDGAIVWELFAVPVVMSYVSSLKYLVIRQSDQSFLSRLATFAMAPAIIIWSWFFLRWLRVVAILRCTDGRWGTRDRVEVRATEMVTTASTQAPA